MSQRTRGGEGTRRGRCEMSNISLRDPDTVTAAESGREFWRGVLLAGGFIALPRWTLEPVPGVGEHEARIPDELVAAVRRLADELAVPLSSVLLTAHAKVLGALSGEREVSTGYAAVEGRLPLPCRMTTEPHSWRGLLLEAHRAESELLSHEGFPVDDLRRELGLTRPLFETVFDVNADDGGDFAEDTVLWVSFLEHDGLVLRLRYRTDVLDPDCAARIAGYHLTALAIFKAGGAYLPIEPHFPSDRIARTLSRAGCRLVLTERGSTATLDHALASLSGIQTLFIDAAYEENHADGDLGVDVAPDQLAYIYFTSGSTGEPKGAMCEHAGMLNHVCAKVRDLGIGEGQVVAQTAPQCFDISLWQLVSALLVGGRTLVVEQEAILDAERFVDKVVEGRVAVLQVVPSYLEVVLSYLEQHPRELSDLRFVSVTGEALKKELAQRWFAAKPEIKLVNAYGLTETSDDTNHEIMERVPDRERVPLGPPIHNVHVYVVDEHLSPVPLGAPGELVFSGVCVGRGYVNDPRAHAASVHGR